MAIAVHELGAQPSLLGAWLAEIRDAGVQIDPLRFRCNLERLGEVAAWEISKTLEYRERVVATPLGEAVCQVLVQQPVLATILRAGLPLHQGLLNYFDRADNAFVSAFRKPVGSGTEFEIAVEYLASPSLDGRTVILADPMLATGRSLALSWQALLRRGCPARLHVVAAIASRAGIAFLDEQLPDGSTLWVGAIDPELNSHAYIVPGLGDAGDLAYGVKL